MQTRKNKTKLKKYNKTNNNKINYYEGMIKKSNTIKILNTNKNNTPNAIINTKLKKESLTISYSGLIISNNIDLTGKNIYYKTEPSITINNANLNKLYMVTMTDPDAPNGKYNTTNNFTFTHWVYIQQNKKTLVYVPYSPPSPPSGIHRYQFNLYDVTDIGMQNLNYLKFNNDVDNRTNYYNNKLKKIKNLNNKKIYFDVNTTQYIVSKQ